MGKRVITGWRMFFLLALIWVLTADSRAGEPASEPGPAVPSAELESCRPYGAVEDLLCGEVEVPENWSSPEGRRIGLALIVIPAREAASEPPLYHLVGGPGSDTSFWPSIYTGAVPWSVGQVAPKLRQARDVVLMDHRGAGGSNPLHCPALDPFHRIEPTFPLDLVEACRDRLAETSDLRQYSTAAAVRDLEAVRVALGHDRVALFGSSYGTSLALAYLRQYPGAVHAAVLSGVLPLDNRVPLEHAAHAESVFEAIFRDCASESVCAAAFPDLSRRWRELLQRLDEEPALVEISRGEERRTIGLGRGPFVESLRSRLGMYLDQREIPWLLDQAEQGRFEPLVERVTRGDGAYFSMGLYLSAQCPATLRAKGRVEGETAGTSLGDYRIRAQLAACEVWPQVETPSGWYEPVRADVPVLLLTGELDHETPAHWAEATAAALPRSRHVEVPNMGHAWFDAEQECFLGVVDAFLRTPDPETLDVGCLAQNPPLPWVLREGGGT